MSHQLYMGVLQGITYCGLTGLKGSDPGVAVTRRCTAMKLRPVHCLREHAGLQSLELRPVHQPVNLDQGLAMEAALTALTWSSCTVGHVRGGPWCLKDLPGSDEAEIKQCVSAMKGKKSLATQSSALVDLAAGMSRSSSLVRHLKHECFKCGLHLSSCTCRSLAGGTVSSRCQTRGSPLRMPQVAELAGRMSLVSTRQVRQGNLRSTSLEQ